MALKSVQEEWLGFSGMVFSKQKPSDVQMEEMRRAFFAGAWAMFCGMKEIGEPDVSEEEGMAHLDRVEAECRAFYENLMKDFIGKN